MPRKGEAMTPEHKAKMAAARRESMEKKKLAKLVHADEAVEAPYELPLPADDDEFAEYVLTAQDKADIEQEVRQRLQKERRLAAKKAYSETEIERQRRKAGEIPADEELKKYNAELVSVYVQMPTLRKPNGGEHDPEPIILDQKVYRSGRWYHDVPRAVAVYLMDRMDQARRHVSQVEGRSRSYFNPSQFQVIHQGGAAAGGGSLGLAFDSIHKRPT
jgi:hypothetical protein